MLAWDSLHDERDILSINSLILPRPVLVPDAWAAVTNPLKPQPALLSLQIQLRQGFHSAAAADSLDANTLHYGELSKAIRSECETVELDVEGVFATVHRLLAAEDRLPAVRSWSAEVRLPKGSMFGDNVVVGEHVFVSPKVPSHTGRALQRRFVIEGIRVSSLIGVNAIERTGKQPLIVSIELVTHLGEVTFLPIRSHTMEEDVRHGLAVEDALVKIIESTSFDTLESLIEFTYQELRLRVLNTYFPGAQFRLTIEKPRAIIFADSPSVEIQRKIPWTQTQVHFEYMRRALAQARRSPPKPTNFCVGACMVAGLPSNSRLIATGFTLECEGNTHAEQCCFIKLARDYECPVERLGEHLQDEISLYTTMEPCNKRSVGNTPCVDRILALKNAKGEHVIKRVFIGVTEPETFVGVNEGRKKLEDAGIEVIHVSGLEEQILAVATAGHEKTA